MPGRETMAGQKRNLLCASVVRFGCGSSSLWEFHAIALLRKGADSNLAISALRSCVRSHPGLALAALQTMSATLSLPGRPLVHT